MSPKLVFPKTHSAQILRLNHEVGYLTANRQPLPERAADVRRRRRVGDLPPVYPNGLRNMKVFRIAGSHTELDWQDGSV